MSVFLSVLAVKTVGHSIENVYVCLYVCQRYFTSEKIPVLFIIQFSYFVVEECSRFHLIYCLV